MGMDRDEIGLIEQGLRAAALDQRKAALDRLATLPADVAVPVLQKLANEPDFMLRRLAVMGLGNHRTEASRTALQQILVQEQDSNVLAEAANSIFEFGETTVPLLAQLFEQTEHWLVRQTIIALLLETQAFEVLLNVAQQALRDHNDSVRESGILTLNRVLNSPLHRKR